MANPTDSPAVTKPETTPMVLIVDDDPVLLKMYTEKFTFEGFKVITARDGEEALKLTEQGSPNIILLDIMLPKMSGTDFLARFRQTMKGKNTPVVALSNLTEAEERDKAIKLGVKEYLAKAMQTPEQVVEVVKKYII